MWCRTILTAVAISCTFTREIIVRAHGQGPQRIVQIKDVICMLLWSGLQKEDLDAKTLEKLNRYNVKIDDLNNEQRRQECLSERVTTEGQREVSGTFINKIGIERQMYPKIEMLLAPSFDNKVVVQREENNNKSKGYNDPISENAQKMPDLENVTKVEGNKGTIRIEYDIRNQQDVESVMNVWTKLTGSNSSVVSNVVDTAPLTTSAALATNTEQEETKKAKTVTPSLQEIHNNGYVHSREMEYINRILAEYLASPTVPTTTQRVSSQSVFSNDVLLKYWKLPNKAFVKEERNNLNKQKHETNKINNVSQDGRRQKVTYNSMLDETKSVPFEVTYDTAQLIKRIQVSPYSQIHRNEVKDRESKPVKNNNPIEILLNFLQMNNALYNNGVLIPEADSTADTIKLFSNTNNEPQDKNKYDIFRSFQNIKYENNNISKNHMINNDESIMAAINVNPWGSVLLSDEKLNKELKALPISKKEMFQVQKLYNQLKIAPLNTIKTRQINPYNDETLVTIEPELMKKIYTNNNRIKFIPPDINNSKYRENFYMENKQPWFQAMVPSIKNVENNNNQVIGMSTRFNKLDQNESMQLLSGKNAVVTDRTDASNADSRILTKWEPPYGSTKIKSVNNFDRDKEQLSPMNVKGLDPTQRVDSIDTRGFQTLPANIIKEIAEKVKIMVLKHIEEVPTTTTTATVTTTLTTVAPTTVSSTSITTITTSEKPSKPIQQEFSQTNQVIQKLMELFKELKAAKETTKLTSPVSQMTTTVSYETKNTPPPLPKRANPQVAASYKPHHMQNFPIQAPIIVPKEKAPQYMPQVYIQPTKDYQLSAITVQTNSGEIPPLAIQLSKPLKFVSQNIILTTKRPVDVLKEEHKQSIIKQVEDKLGIPTKAGNHREDLKHKSTFSTKHDILSEDLKQHESRDHYFYKSKYMNREKPWYNHDYNEKVHKINTHPVMPELTELQFPGRLSHLQHLGRPREFNFEDLNHSSGLTRPGLNELGSHQNGARHHTYSLSNYDHQPLYETTKFHEKLEKIGDWSQNSWKDLKELPTQNSDEIPDRQQMQLMKVKQRTRYDDSHFKKFLKSQQKVTDMLEKILANNVKNSAQHSVETL